MLWLLACVAPDDPAPPPVDTAPAHDSAPVDDSVPVVPPDTSPLPPDTGHADEPLPICINEFMPDNASAVYDAAGAASDWIELHNPGAADVDLDGWALTDDPDNTDKSVLAGTVLPAGGFLLLWAVGDGPKDTGDTAGDDPGDTAGDDPGDTAGDTASALAPDQLSFRLSGSGGAVGLYAPDGRGSIVRYGRVDPDFSIARATDCCTGEGCLGYSFRGTPGYSNEPPVYDDIVLVGAGSTWRYWASDVVDAGWTDPDYNDSAWIDGEAPLGYGDAQTTIIPYGPDPYTKWPTAWFRLYFIADDPASWDSLSLGLLRDDGAAVYLNGVEIVRDNLPEGELTASTLAEASTASESAYYTFPLDPLQVDAGLNVLAVEVHQASVDSSDLSFDLTLEARRRLP